MTAAQVNVGQRQGRERPRGVLLKPAVAHLGESPQALDHRKDMLDPGTHPRFVAVLGPLNFVHLACTAGALVGEVLGLGGLARYQCFLAGIGRVPLDALHVTRAWTLIIKALRVVPTAELR